jgi:hypothetical protein
MNQIRGVIIQKENDNHVEEENTQTTPLKKRLPLLFQPLLSS